MMAELLVGLALGCVLLAVGLIAQYDGASTDDGRSVVSLQSLVTVPGSRARRRADRKPSPALYLLLCVLALLVIAAIA
jgi:hypothetical protein